MLLKFEVGRPRPKGAEAKAKAEVEARGYETEAKANILTSRPNLWCITSWSLARRCCKRYFISGQPFKASQWNREYRNRGRVITKFRWLTALRCYVQKTCFRENRKTRRSHVPLRGHTTFVQSTPARTETVIDNITWTYDICAVDTSTYYDCYWQYHDDSSDVNKTRPSI